ncbi:ABC-type antimicrobial peptide transport system, permease component [Desulfomonile tiedjei DSM 6799]|uniref:ABC-type antimicrobial peptide transport system, permease component n=1 Tax=Desulfomonile tiedjei (strain ATCC 49306 / DSM 6799 / DCB-1) TaxID=706587 RepID=I4C9E8_DESTA|nr:ABC-type antimicrobial peptide transport system, permease component [Desulfomonile tiedjei DSM 6799]
MRTGQLRDFRIAIRSLTGHPLRVALSVLAIMIGVASLIVLVGIGRGSEQKIRKVIEDMGPNLIVVSAGQSRVVKGQLGQMGMMTNLTLKDANAIAAECPSVRTVAPAYFKKMLVKFENMTYSTKIVGTMPSIQEARNVSVRPGSFFDETENSLMAPVAVIGPTVVESLFGLRDPIGASIMIGRVMFHVIGVTASKGSVAGEDQDDQIFVPLRTAMVKLMNVTYLSTVYVEAAGVNRIHTAGAEIKSLLRERHRLRENKEDDFTIRNQTDVMETQKSVAKTFSLLVASIAISSLIIGGVGILGVMLLSIRERISEIGIRRAVGAKRRDILVQFLVESSFLGILGGIAGLFLGLGASFGVKATSGIPVILQPDYIVLSLVFSLATGLVFGIYPSWKAARLDPIEALNTEA